MHCMLKKNIPPPHPISPKTMLEENMCIYRVKINNELGEGVQNIFIENVSKNSQVSQHVCPDHKYKIPFTIYNSVCRCPYQMILP